MTPELLSIIQCPSCQSEDLFVESDSVPNEILNNGWLICRKCAKRIKIENGLLNCLDNRLDPIVEKEIRGNIKMLQRERFNADEGWLLSLPHSFGDIHKDLQGHDALSDLRYLVDQMSIPEGGYVIDLGAGACWASSYLRRWGYKPIAMDISTEKYVGLSSAETYFRNFNFYFNRVLMEMESLRLFRDSSVDGIIAISVIHHSRNIINTLKEAARILKPGASFGAVEGCCGIFDNKQSVLNSSEEVREYAWNEHIYTVWEFRKIFSQAKLNLKILPAPSTFIKMDSFNLKNVHGDSGKYLLFNYLERFIWKNKLIKNILKNKLLPKIYWFICTFVSLSFIGIAKKDVKEKSQNY
jgi:ubiquinone/menaquinone biosynthesis C-methylase UbiE/uncharacterized protein YbaR (Trm112 family)